MTGIGELRRLIGLAAIFTLAVVNIWLYAQGYRLSGDEVDFHYVAMGPDSMFWPYVAQAAIGQGRIGHLIVVPLNVFGASIADWVIARYAFAAIYFAGYVSFAYYLSRLLRNDLTLLFSTSFFLISPLLYYHTPPTSYPLQVTVPILLAILCRISIVRSSDGAHWLSRILFGVALIATEYSFLFGTAMLAIEYGTKHLATNEKSFRYGLYSIVQDKAARADFAVCVVVAVAYFGFRLVFPSNYVGNSMDGLGNIPQLLGVMWRHIANGTIFPHLSVETDFAIRWYGLGLFLCTSSAVVAAAMAPKKAPDTRQAKTLLWLLIAGLAYVMFPFGAIQRLQEWCYIHNVCTYLSVRLALFFIVPMLCIILLRCRSALVAGLGVVAALGFTANWHTAMDMRNHVRPYEQVRRIACGSHVPESVAAEVDPDSIISMNPHMTPEIYWDRYIAYVRGGGC